MRKPETSHHHEGTCTFVAVLSTQRLSVLILEVVRLQLKDDCPLRIIKIDFLDVSSHGTHPLLVIKSIWLGWRLSFEKTRERRCPQVCYKIFDHRYELSYAGPIYSPLLLLFLFNCLLVSVAFTLSTTSQKVRRVARRSRRCEAMACPTEQRACAAMARSHRHGTIISAMDRTLSRHEHEEQPEQHRLANRKQRNAVSFRRKRQQRRNEEEEGGLQ